MHKKSALVSAILFILGANTVLAADSPFQVLSDLWYRILGVFAIGWLDGEWVVVSFMRFIIWILVFVLLFEGSGHVPGIKDFARKNRVVVALCISIIAAVFLPGAILMALGTAYGTFVAFVLLGVPVVAAAYAIWRLPGTNGFQLGIRLAILFMLLWILHIVGSHAQAMV